MPDQEFIVEDGNRELANEYISMELNVRLVYNADCGWRSYMYPGGDFLEELSRQNVVEWIDSDHKFVPVYERRFVCSLHPREEVYETCSYPSEAAILFLYRLATQPGWRVKVQDVETNDVFIVNGKSGEIEEYL